MKVECLQSDERRGVTHTKQRRVIYIILSHPKSAEIHKVIFLDSLRPSIFFAILYLDELKGEYHSSNSNNVHPTKK